MNVQAVRELYSAKPFRPFRIHLADGQTLVVEHPEQLAIAGRTLFVAGPNDSFELVDLFLIVSLKPRVNGAHRGGRH